jgi:hypothetical protein
MGKRCRKRLAPRPKNNSAGLALSFRMPTCCGHHKISSVAQPYCSAAPADSISVRKSPAIVVEIICSISCHTFCVSSG